MSLADRRDLLVLVLDVVIPAEDGFPGAGAIALDHVLAAAAASGELERLLSAGLDAVDKAARADGASGLAMLAPDDREALLRRVEPSHAAFIEALVRHAYDAYYSHPTVIARLGLDPRPIHPRGHALEPAELPDLSRVTARGPIYRRA